MRKNTYRTIGTLAAAVMLFAGATVSANLSKEAKAQTVTIDSGTYANPSFMISGQAGWLYDANNPVITDRAGNPLRNTWIKFDLTNSEVASWAKDSSYPNYMMTVECYKYTPSTTYMYADENGYYNHDGWKQIDGVWYYFNSNHFLITNFWAENKYFVDSSGAWVQDKVDDGSTDLKITVDPLNFYGLGNTTTTTTTTTNTTTNNTTTETNENGVPKLEKGHYMENGIGWIQDYLPRKNLLN